jgi:hypothetical protein
MKWSPPFILLMALYLSEDMQDLFGEWPGAIDEMIVRASRSELESLRNDLMSVVGLTDNQLRSLLSKDNLVPRIDPNRTQNLMCNWSVCIEYIVRRIDIALDLPSHVKG